MVNVSISSGKSPVVWIQLEICFHILVYQLLQVNAYFTICTYDHVCANTLVCRYVTHGIRDGKVSRIVSNLIMGETDSCFRQVGALRI